MRDDDRTPPWVWRVGYGLCALLAAAGIVQMIALAHGG